MNPKVEALLRGETIISKEPGSSMLPLIKSRQPVRLSPVTWEQCEINDIVYCRIGKRYYTHKVVAKGQRGCQIANNKGFINGWTKQIFGKVVEILNS